MSNQTEKQLGIFATIGFVFRTACSVIVKLCTQTESTLDVSQDLIDVAKAHSSNFKQQTQQDLDAQLKAAE